MKEAGTEAKQVGGADLGSKDKRWLVLFLLGGCMLTLPFFARDWQEEPPPVAIALADGGDHWQVLSLNGGPDEKRAPREKINLLSQQSIASYHFFDDYNESVFPAELALFFNRPLPLNSSAQSDLELLPGIGPHLAAKMMAERGKKGRFTSPEDLLDVPGIGPASLQRLLPLVSFE